MQPLAVAEFKRMKTLRHVFIPRVIGVSDEDNISSAMGAFHDGREGFLPRPLRRAEGIASENSGASQARERDANQAAVGGRGLGAYPPTRAAARPDAGESSSTDTQRAVCQLGTEERGKP